MRAADLKTGSAGNSLLAQRFLQAEQAVLAAWAVRSDQAGGREHPDPEARWWPAFLLDRHRIVHSTAFRRLEYKTQAFVITEGDHFRTRLTHTLEVAHIGRQIATGLALNAALVEVIALAHDLGHPPFGHAGEAALAERMRDCGGFDHNRQSLRVVELLEHPYPDFYGLNLTRQVRQALAMHASRYDCPTDHPLADRSQPSLEAQAASLADRLAYDCHDLEDALGAGLIGEDQLSELGLWREAAEPIRSRYPDRPTPAIRRPVLDRLVRLLIDDVISESSRQIASLGLQSPDQVQAIERPLIQASPARQAQLEQIEAFLHARVYSHRVVIRMDARARRLVHALFDAYLAEPRLLPDRFARRIDQQGPQRVICDYIAGMTDRFCQDEYRRLFEPFERI